MSSFLLRHVPIACTRSPLYILLRSICCFHTYRLPHGRRLDPDLLQAVPPVFCRLNELPAVKFWRFLTPTSIYTVLCFHCTHHDAVDAWRPFSHRLPSQRVYQSPLGDEMEVLRTCWTLLSSISSIIDGFILLTLIVLQCQKSIYPFHDGAYEDFEPIFQKLIEV